MLQIIRAYAALFGVVSTGSAGGRRERIAPQAFSRVGRYGSSFCHRGEPGNEKGIVCRIDHKHDVASTGAGSLHLWTDARGLGFEATLPDTDLGQRLADWAHQGLFRGCSFQSCKDLDHHVTCWEGRQRIDDLMDARTLFEVSLLLNETPAYAQTQRTIQLLEYANEDERLIDDVDRRLHAAKQEGTFALNGSA